MKIIQQTVEIKLVAGLSVSDNGYFFRNTIQQAVENLNSKLTFAIGSSDYLFRRTTQGNHVFS